MHVDDIKNKIKVYEKLLEMIDISPSSLEEEIFLMYAQFGKVTEVARHLNDKGLRLEGMYQRTRKYTSDDVTRVLEDKRYKDLINLKLYKLVLKIKAARKLTDEIILAVFNEE